MPRSFFVLNDQLMIGVCIWPITLPTGSPSFICTLPRTMVYTGSPLTFHPPQGVGWFLLCSLLGSIVASLFMSTIVRSPSDPTRIVPFLGYICQTLATFSLWTLT